MTTFGAVLVAAGSGERLGAAVPKALVSLRGTPLVCLALDALIDAGASDVVVVVPPSHRDRVLALLPRSGPPCTVVDGGRTRTESVRAGLAALPAGVTTVAVHDAARALMPAATIRDTVAVVTGDVVAAAPALPVADTLKRVTDGQIVATVDRDELVAVQTPQVFRRSVLEAAHLAGGDATDDLALVERLVAAGAAEGRLVVTAGSPLGLKITYPHDLVVAAALQEGGA